MIARWEITSAWRDLQMKRLRVLLSAYACEPDRGSEPGVGWNVAQEIGKYHDVWVLTRASSREAIERASQRCPLPGVRFVYYDARPWISRWNRGVLGMQVYYYLWQVGAYALARKLNRELRFDVVHHITFAKHWMPSFLALLPVPFIWGPVGGGDSAPIPFWRAFSTRGKIYEVLRAIGRWFGEHDPFVRQTARRSVVALAKTEETANRLRRLGAEEIQVFPGEGLPTAELDTLTAYPLPKTNGAPIRFIGLGMLLHLKGFDLGLRAFALANVQTAEYWIIGDGPERNNLESLAQALGIRDRVRFWGWLPRHQALRKLGEGHTLVHPSLHDSGGWVCAEAMAAGRPVICLDLAGPAVQVTEDTGVKVRAGNPEQAIHDIAAAMERLARDATLRAMMGHAGRQRSLQVFSWEHKGKLLDALYRRVAGVPQQTETPAASREDASCLR